MLENRILSRHAPIAIAVAAGVFLGAFGILVSTRQDFGKHWIKGIQKRDLTVAVPLPLQLAVAESRRNASLPYLFDTAAQPTLDEACGHCADKATVPDKATQSGLLGTPSVMTCCGVCQYEGRHCALMAPPGAMEAHIKEYSEDFGFDFEAFSPAELFARLQGKTLWLLGDSQTWHWYYAFECFMRRFAVNLERQVATKDLKAYQQLSLVHFPVIVPPTCIQLLKDTRICAVRVDGGADMASQTLPTLHRIRGEAFRNDIAVANFGLHFGGKNIDKLQQQLRVLSQYTSDHRDELPEFIWRTTSVQHFATPKGQYDPASLGQQCKPLTAFYEANSVAASGGALNLAAAEEVSRAGWSVLNTYNATVPLWDVHKTGECTHYCSPSAYHVWVWLLNQLFIKNDIGNSITHGYKFPEL